MRSLRSSEALIKDTEMFVLIPGLVLASLLGPGTTQEFNGYFNAAAGGNSDDSCSRILCHRVLNMNTAFRLDIIY